MNESNKGTDRTRGCIIAFAIGVAAVILLPIIGIVAIRTIGKKVEPMMKQAASSGELLSVKVCLDHAGPSSSDYSMYTGVDSSGETVECHLSIKPVISFEDIVPGAATIGSSYAGTNQGKATIELPLTESGKAKFLKATSEHIMQRMAIFLGGRLIVAPQVREPYGGPLVIEGGFEDSEANKIIAELNRKAGAESK